MSSSLYPLPICRTSERARNTRVRNQKINRVTGIELSHPSFRSSPITNVQLTNHYLGAELATFESDLGETLYIAANQTKNCARP
ncbi:hypothetical protein BC2230_60260 [Burkholderia cepacia]